MSVLFSKGCEYGLRAVLYISAHPDRRVGIREVSETLNFPTHFLAKVLQSLSEHGIFNSYKGVGGGFSLARPPEEIRLIEVVEAIDGLALFSQCALGFSRCGDDNGCPLHDRWGGIRDQIRRMLDEESVADMMNPSHQRLTDLVQKAQA